MSLTVPTVPPGSVPPQIEAFLPALRRYFARRAKTGEIEDLVQEVFLRMQAHRSGGPIEHLDRYLFTVAASVLSDHGRRRAVRLLDAHESLEDTHHPAEDLSPERVILDREALDLVVRAIGELPPRTREIFVLHRFEEMSCNAIAGQLGISASAVEKHIMKALRVLHERLRAD